MRGCTLVFFTPLSCRSRAELWCLTLTVDIMWYVHLFVVAAMSTYKCEAVVGRGAVLVYRRPLLVYVYCEREFSRTDLLHA